MGLLVNKLITYRIKYCVAQTGLHFLEDLYISLEGSELLDHVYLKCEEHQTKARF